MTPDDKTLRELAAFARTYAGPLWQERAEAIERARAALRVKGQLVEALEAAQEEHGKSVLFSARALDRMERALKAAKETP